MRDLRCIATHERLPKGQLGRGRLPGRRPPGHAPPGLELLRPVFDELGQEAVDFLRGLERAFPRYTAYHARKVLALRERYKIADLVAAMKHALRFGAFATPRRPTPDPGRRHVLGTYGANRNVDPPNRPKWIRS